MPPKRSRTPIDYTPRDADALFRNQSDVDAELASIERSDDMPAAPPDRGANERTLKPRVLPTREAPKVRHSFDVPRSQLGALYDIQDQRRRLTGTKPTMGALLEEALADFIGKQRPIDCG